MKKRILITGSNGLLGQKLIELLRGQEGVDLIATARGANRLPVTEGYTYASLDITVPSEVHAIFDQFKPEVVIHTAAMTNVDTCETDRAGCDLLNVDAVAFLIEACEKHGTYLCH
ncbi:MAG: dTDP-4-dehydrorhamnose reductase, partial [Bacteroidota bacterium]